MSDDTKETAKERMKRLREKSGSVSSSDPLVSFLYELMRDSLPAGRVEEILINSIHNPSASFTNGWLAQYAEDLAHELYQAEAISMKSALQKAFASESVSSKNSSSEVNDAADGYVHRVSKKINYEYTNYDTVSEAEKEARSVIDDIASKGNLPEDSIEQLYNDISEMASGVRDSSGEEQ